MYAADIFLAFVIKRKSLTVFFSTTGPYEVFIVWAGILLERNNYRPLTLVNLIQSDF